MLGLAVAGEGVREVESAGSCGELGFSEVSSWLSCKEMESVRRRGGSE